MTAEVALARITSQRPDVTALVAPQLGIIQVEPHNTSFLPFGAILMLNIPVQFPTVGALHHVLLPISRFAHGFFLSWRTLQG